MDKLLIGAYEWCELPDLRIPAIKAKVDTGAQTSALHALDIKSFTRKGERYVKFTVYPLQGNKRILIHCKALVIDQRYVMSSNGQKEHRYVISTTLALGDVSWPIEVTLSNRDPLRFRMLLGREALTHRTLIDPSLTCHQGKLWGRDLHNYYKNNVR